MYANYYLLTTWGGIVLVLQCATFLLQCVVSYFSARCRFFSTPPHFLLLIQCTIFLPCQISTYIFIPCPILYFSTSYLTITLSFLCFLLFTVCPFCLCVLPLFCVCVCVCVCVLEFGHWGVWGELASHKRLFNPPPQFSRLGTWCPALMFCMSNICERG